jgi:hypothetical protein
LAVASVRDWVALALSWIPVRCVCAVPRLGSKTAPNVAIESAYLNFAPIMV